MLIAEDTIHVFRPPCFGEVALLFPLGCGRVRCYVVTARRTQRSRLSGGTRIGDFIRTCTDCGVPAEWFVGATPSGPLASFEGTSSWVEHPHQMGVALVGDAPGTTDPTYGEGQALTLRDVRVLGDSCARRQIGMLPPSVCL
jgi:2-polyprenyl-6-methoxyphenol hydroxylase-like FAD-dependent oxidoreductase